MLRDNLSEPIRLLPHQVHKQEPITHHHELLSNRIALDLDDTQLLPPHRRPATGVRMRPGDVTCPLIRCVEVEAACGPESERPVAIGEVQYERTVM